MGHEKRERVRQLGAARTRDPPHGGVLGCPYVVDEAPAERMPNINFSFSEQRAMIICLLTNHRLRRSRSVNAVLGPSTANSNELLVRRWGQPRPTATIC